MALTENQNIREHRIPVPASIFRAYDIRGIEEQELNAGSIRRIGQAVASEALASGI